MTKTNTNTETERGKDRVSISLPRYEDREVQRGDRQVPFSCLSSFYTLANLEATCGGGGNTMRYCQVPDVEALPGEAKQDALLVAQDQRQEVCCWVYL